MSDHTPTPWSLCGDGKCSCFTISCPDHPITKVMSGEWGDDYPAMRMVGGTLDNKYEAYMAQINYGAIDKEVATANAAFIVRAVNNHEALIAALETAYSQLVTLGGDVQVNELNGDRIQAEVLRQIEAVLVGLKEHVDARS